VEVAVELVNTVALQVVQVAAVVVMYQLFLVQVELQAKEIVVVMAAAVHLMELAAEAVLVQVAVAAHHPAPELAVADHSILLAVLIMLAAAVAEVLFKVQPDRLVALAEVVMVLQVALEIQALQILEVEVAEV
jgi:hypothetical protein